MENKLIAPRLCLECRDPFTPRFPKQKFCPKPARCAYQAQSRQRRGQAPTAAIAGRKRAAAAVRDDRLQGRFGVLSEREVALFDYAYRLGYDVGYQSAYTPLRKGVRRDAA